MSMFSIKRFLLVMVPLVALGQLFCSSMGTIAPELAKELDLSPDDLGVLSGAFFFALAVLQIPVGILLDRFGERTVLSSMMVSTVAGALVFATAENFMGILVARLLIGTGCSGLLIGALAVVKRRFPPEHFMKGLAVLFAGANAGGLAATLPLVGAVSTCGWRATFAGLAAVSGAVAIAFFMVIRDTPATREKRTHRPESLAAVSAGVQELFRTRGLLCVLPLMVVGYASVTIVLSLWGGQYLHDIYALSDVTRGNVLCGMAGAMILGTYAYGHLGHRSRTRRDVVTVGALTSSAFP